MNRKSDWESLIGTPIRVEGRIQTQGKTAVKLTECSLLFEIDEVQSRKLTNASNAELTGGFEKRGGRLVFKVDRAEAFRSDLDNLRSREVTIGKGTPQEFYDLAAWGFHRAKFYKDDFLRSEAERVAGRGLRNERNQVRNATAEQIWNFGKKGHDLGAASRVRFELLHEACSQIADELSARKPLDATLLSLWIARVEQELAGWKDPFPETEAKLRLSYATSPVSVYDNAKESLRPLLHRLVYLKLLLLKIESRAENDGSNGHEIAAEIQRFAPEQGEVAKSWKTRYDNFRIEQAKVMSRTDIQRLIADLQKEDRPDLLQTAVKTWWEGRQSRFRDDGSEGIIQLARDRRDVFKEEREGLRWLLEAIRKNPNDKLIAEELGRWGYVKVEDRWETAERAAKVTVKQEPGAIPNLKVGMTATQLRQLLGRPTTSMRVLTARGVSEVWRFGEKQGSQLTIELERTATDQEAKVSRIGGEK